MSLVKYRIGDIFSVKGGKRLPKGSEFSLAKTQHPYLRVTDFRRNGIKENGIKYIDNSLHEKIRRYTISSNDVFISIAGTIGIAGIIPTKYDGANLTENAAKLIPKNGYVIDNKYTSYYLNSPKVQQIIKSKTMAVGVPKLALFRIEEIPFPLPPLTVQKKIAAILDAADAYRQKTKVLIEKYDELTQSLFLDMFGDPVRNEKGWEEKTIFEISTLVTKGSSPKWQGFDYVEQGVRFVTSENVRIGYLDCSKDKFIPVEFHNKLTRSQLKENDLLVNLVGASIGRGALMVKKYLPANINQAVAKIELNFELVNAKFLLNQVVTPQIQDRLIGNKVEGARANISLKNVRELLVIYPPFHLQNEFAERVHVIETQKAQAQASLAKSEDLFNSLLQRAFKGDEAIFGIAESEHLEMFKRRNREAGGKAK